MPQRAWAIVAIAFALMLSYSNIVVPSFMSSTLDSAIASKNFSASSDYSDLLKYEWTQIQGNSAFTRFSAGPAPEAPDILWKTSIPGIQSYVAAFNGKVFVTTTTDVIALEKDTGNIIWQTTLPTPQRWPAVYKIDDNHLVVDKYCLNPENGTVLWSSNSFSASANFFSDGTYSTEEKLFFTKGKSSVQAWNFSDPSEPPMMAWETYVPGGGSVGSSIQYGDGKIFPGSFDAHQMALDAKTGDVLWDTETTGAMIFSGAYYKGRFLRGGMDNQFYCFNASNGTVLWVFNPGTDFGHWSSGCAVAYEKVYQVNKDGHLYALDINKGEVVWKYKGPSFIFFPGWSVVADGKVYATTGQASSTDPYTGEYSRSEFVCLDAFTGSLLWKLPIEAHAPRESVALAYGNLYMIPGFISEDQMDSYTTLNEVWAISSKPWTMWRHDPAHTGTGQSGPTNLTLRWKFTTGGAVVSSPSVVDDKVYVGSNDKNLYCLDALTGRLVWNFTTGFRIKSSPAVANGKVYVGPDDGYVYCLDAENGNLLWNSSAGGYIPAHFDAVARLSSSPLVVEDKVYVGSLDTNLYCFDANHGNVLWTHKTAGYITSSPAFADNAVYIISQEPASGALYKLYANNGSVIWKLPLPYQLTAERGTDMHASPVIADGMVFASSNKVERYGINATTGEIEWTFGNIKTEFIIDSPAYGDGKLFFVDLLFLDCVDAKNGSMVWKTYLGEVLESSPTYADGKVYVAGSDKRAVYVLNATNGERLSWFRTGSKGWSSPTLYKGRMYVGNHDWNVYCFVDASFPVTATSIVANLSNGTVNRAKAESVTVAGQIKPAIASAPITVTFVKPTGATVDLAVSANEQGNFTVSFTPDVVGNWTITASYSGAEYASHAYASANSADLHLVVEELEQTLTLPPEMIFAAIALVIIVIVIAAGYTITRNRNLKMARETAQTSRCFFTL